MTVQEILPYLLALNTLASIGALLYTWLSSSGKQALSGLEKLKAESTKSYEELKRDSTVSFSGLNARCGIMEQHVAVLQSTVDHLPSKDTTHRLEVSMAGIEGRIEALTERLAPIAAMATRLQEQAMREREPRQ